MKRIEVIASPKFIAMVKAEIAENKKKFEKIFEQIKMDKEKRLTEH